MKRKWSEGYILLEALVALGILTICLFVFLHGMMVMLKQRTRQERRMQMTRVMYQEAKEVLRRGGETEKTVIYQGAQIKVILEKEGQRDAVKAVFGEEEIKIQRLP